ncbi:MAG: hypothetical protein ACRC50_08520 [Gaiella sp.]
MDSFGARLLAARIAAGVRIGAVIELVRDAGELQAGDRGTVRAVSPAGGVLVEWDRGFDREIDPVTTPFRKT